MATIGSPLASGPALVRGIAIAFAVASLALGTASVSRSTVHPTTGSMAWARLAADAASWEAGTAFGDELGYHASNLSFQTGDTWLDDTLPWSTNPERGHVSAEAGCLTRLGDPRTFEVTSQCDHATPRAAVMVQAENAFDTDCYSILLNFPTLSQRTAWFNFDRTCSVPLPEGPPLEGFAANHQGARWYDLLVPGQGTPTPNSEAKNGAIGVALAEVSNLGLYGSFSHQPIPDVGAQISSTLTNGGVRLRAGCEAKAGEPRTFFAEGSMSTVCRQRAAQAAVVQADVVQFGSTGAIRSRRCYSIFLDPGSAWFNYSAGCEVALPKSPPQAGEATRHEGTGWYESF